MSHRVHAPCQPQRNTCGPSLVGSRSSSLQFVKFVQSCTQGSTLTLDDFLFALWRKIRVLNDGECIHRDFLYRLLLLLLQLRTEQGELEKMGAGKGLRGVRVFQADVNLA